MNLLAKYGQGAGWIKHCVSVAEATAKVGRILAKNRPIDCSFLWSAALLHDIGRYKTHDLLLHGVEGYKLLRMLGHEKEAYVCASHILFGLTAKEAVSLGLPDHEFVPRTIEEKLVPLVDYLIEYDQPTTLDNRFSSLCKRNSSNTRFLDGLHRAQKKARIVMLQIEDEIGDSVERIISHP